MISVTLFNVFEALRQQKHPRFACRPMLPHHASGILGLAIAALCGIGLDVAIAAPPPSSPKNQTSIEIIPAPTPLPGTNDECGLTLTDLEQISLGGNPSLARAAARIGAARGNWVQVGLLPNPVVGYDGQQLGSGGLAEQQGIVYNQEIVRGGKLRLNRAIAAQDINRARFELTAQEQRVLTDVRIGYFQVLVAQRQIELTAELVQVGKSGFDAANSLFKAEQAGKADVLQAQLETENAQILSENAHNRFRSSWSSLAAVIGQPDLAPQKLTGEPTFAPLQFDFQDVNLRLQAASPEIAAASTAITRARFTAERAHVEPKPNVSFQGLVNAIDNGIGGRPDGAVGVTIPLPVFNRNQGAIMQAHHEIVVAERALAQLQLDLQNRLASVFERYANARNQVERYQKSILSIAQQSLDLTRRTYVGGEISFVTYLVAQRTFAQTNLNYLESVRELRTAEAEIEGLLLSGSLQNR